MLHQTHLFDERTASMEWVAQDVLLLRSFATPTTPLVSTIEEIAARCPFRQMRTRGGARMSVAMTNCGPWGWCSDLRGYRYVATDPSTGRPWPAMPAPFLALAATAAQQAGFTSFNPDACLVNRYVPGARMGAHRDQDEADMAQPIVSVSIGLPAVFLWYGASRKGRPRSIALADGDVLVWGRSARTGYHGVRPLAAAEHPVTGAVRYNLTLRRAH